MSGMFSNSLADLLLKAQQQREEKLKKLTNCVDPKIIFGWNVSFSPIYLGNNFVVLRSWQEEEHKQQSYYDSKRKMLKIDPGVSFGWANATTEIMLNFIEKYWQGGNLLDVGTGTGILSIGAAQVREVCKIDAFDVDANIVDEARRNIKLNNLQEKINIKLTEIDEYPSKCYDVVLANLFPEIHHKLYKKLFDKVKKDGYLMISGFPTKFEGKGGAYFNWEPTLTKGDDKKVIEKLYKNLGLKVIEHVSLRGYSALVFQKV